MSELFAVELPQQLKGSICSTEPVLLTCMSVDALQLQELVLIQSSRPSIPDQYLALAVEQLNY